MELPTARNKLDLRQVVGNGKEFEILQFCWTEGYSFSFANQNYSSHSVFLFFLSWGHIISLKTILDHLFHELFAASPGALVHSQLYACHFLQEGTSL